MSTMSTRRTQNRTGTGRHLPRPQLPTGRMDEQIQKLWHDTVRFVDAAERALAEQDRQLEALRARLAKLEGEAHETTDTD